MKIRSLLGGIVFIVFGLFLVFTGNAAPYGVPYAAIFIGAGLFPLAIGYFLWSRDQRAIRRSVRNRQ